MSSGSVCVLTSQALSRYGAAVSVVALAPACVALSSALCVMLKRITKNLLLCIKRLAKVMSMFV